MQSPYVASWLRCLYGALVLCLTARICSPLYVELANLLGSVPAPVMQVRRAKVWKFLVVEPVDQTNVRLGLSALHLPQTAYTVETGSLAQMLEKAHTPCAECAWIVVRLWPRMGLNWALSDFVDGIATIKLNDFPQTWDEFSISHEREHFALGDVALPDLAYIPLDLTFAHDLYVEAKRLGGVAGPVLLLFLMTVILHCWCRRPI